MNKMKKLIPISVGTYIKASIKFPAVVHDEALPGLEYIPASFSPLAPIGL